MRYVQCYRREAIQCREDNIQPTSYVLRSCVSQTTTSTLDCFAAYHRYVSQVRWRLRKDGQGEAQPCPGAMRRDGGRGYVRARRGETTPALRATPPKRGIIRARRGVIPRTSQYLVPRPNPIPLLGGVPPQGRGGFPAVADATPRVRPLQSPPL
ncbi:MAG: hypothetical protein LBM98_11595 [Oscillospiraceae bacterium]|nr:hypothetical protein [Oscillospiraceae bacterium]